ncbi:MAG TPA: DUF4124 domain-containing protein [Steroidobacteraceae bacterium]|jgi:hypothetical protein|nr:DUF4124 domain-containing protein [Steroidobacteraceae bacterium]
MRKLAFTLMSLMCSLALAATVYKWVDENGVVHYSDQPHPNAEKLQVKDAQTFPHSSPSVAPSAAGAPPPPTAQRVGPAYQGCAVVQPTDQQDFMNVDALTISVQTDPGLKPGDQIFVNLDGAPLNNGKPTGGQFSLSPVDRGTHTVAAQIRDSDGTVLCQTPTVSFSVHQPSLLNPNTPIRPH